MPNIGFKNFRDPVVYILNQELRKRDLKNRISIEATPEYNGKLTEYPVQLIRDSTTNKVIKCIYGEGPEQWSEEIISDNNGTVTHIKTVFPNGSMEVIQFNRESDGLINSITKV